MGSHRPITVNRKLEVHLLWSRRSCNNFGSIDWVETTSIANPTVDFEKCIALSQEPFLRQIGCSKMKSNICPAVDNILDI